MLEFKINGNKSAYMVSPKKIDGKNVQITGDLVIPSSHEGLPINEVEYYQFTDMEITSLTIEEGIKRLCTGAFKDCKKLKSVKLPSTLEKIEGEVFNGCDALEEINLPEGLTEVGLHAFSDTAIKTLKLPSTLKEFGMSRVCAYELPENSENFKSVNGAILSKDGKTFVAYPSGKEEEVFVIPEGVEIISTSAFSGAKLNEIIFPSTLKKVGESAFSEMPNIKRCILPEGVEELGDWLFDYETIVSHSPLEELSLPNSLKILNSSTLPKSEKYLKEHDGGLYVGNSTNPYLVLVKTIDSEIYSFNVHNDCKHIASEAFYWRQKLKSLVIPEGVISIGNYAFSNCKALGELVLPKSLRYVDYKTFDGLSNASVTVLSDDFDLIFDPYYWKNIGCYLNNYLTSCKFFFLGKYSYDMPNGVKIDLRQVKRIEKQGDYDLCEMPATTTRKLVENRPLSEEVFGEEYEDVAQNTQRFLIGRSNFGDTSLKKPCYSIIAFVNVKDGDDDYSGTPIEPYANLIKVADREEVEIKETTNIIEATAFKNCPSLNKLILPASIKTIAKNAFENCKNIKEVHFKGSICDWAKIKFSTASTNPLYKGATLFIDGEPVKNVEIDDDLEEIGSYAFVGANIESAVIPESVVEVGFGAFENCKNLISIEIPFVGKSLKEEVYTNLGYIFGTTSSEKNSTYVPTSLREVVITNAEHIDSSAFSGCKDIETIKILAADSIGEGFVSDCDNLTELYLPYLGNNYDATPARLGYSFNGSMPKSLKKLTIAHGRKLDEGAIPLGLTLESLTLPPELEVVNANYFKVSGGFEEVDGAYYIGSEDNPFYALYKVSETATSVKVTDMTEIILSNAFRGSSVTEVKLGKMVRIIAPRAFDEATKIKTVEFAVPLGWEYAPTSGGKVVDLKKTLTNAKKSAKLLTNKACEMHWRKR